MLLALPIALAAALLPSVQAGMYGQPVLNLDAKSFKQAMATEHAAMVAFVAPWCGHCKNLGPEYTAAAQSLSPLIPFYAIDCDDQKNKGLCAEYGIQGFPTIKAFPKASKGPAKDYQGERKKGALIEYAKNLVPDKVKKLRVDKEGKEDDIIKGFLQEKSTLPHVLLVHPSAPSIPFLWKVLAHRLSGKMHLGFVRDTTSHSILSSLEIYDSADTAKDATRVVSWPAEATSHESLAEFEGAMKFNALLEWLQFQLTGETSTSNDSEKVKGGSKKQKPVKVPEPIQTGSSDDGDANVKEERSVKSEAAARRAKLDEAERRDKERREKAELRAKQDKAEEEARGTSDYLLDHNEQEKREREKAKDGSSTVNAPAPEAVPQEPMEDHTAREAALNAEKEDKAADPSPEQVVTDGEEEPVAEKTSIPHEEL
ncbi:protein disulfide-isomerase domain [Kwoniella dejecticola CBS 10117]|uniref:Protein disulfide-isomerase domain n=1 Tax=Kwoniella dejecticola CBS 10117 TaxID=1296121 RepID=A0A1A6AAJ0_9TREE|nr:protein disulfide-isomerase domain [Kwoniella dejecticola CBS 10117]OBR87082.1 protein disulfide-isomerase domain [Kwoniella dejecticola CBS 10117]